MGNFPRIHPQGFPPRSVLPSWVVTLIDANLSKAVNGDGSEHDGDVTLGSLRTHRELRAMRDVYAEHDLVAGRDAHVGRDLHVHGQLVSHGPVVEAPAVFLTDRDHLLDTSTGGQRIVLPTPAQNRVMTLRQITAPVPPEGFWFELLVHIRQAPFTVGIKREGAVNDYVAIIGDGTPDVAWHNVHQIASVRVQVVQGVWRLVPPVGGKAFGSSHA